jgi:hypothetical protein
LTPHFQNLPLGVTRIFQALNQHVSKAPKSCILQQVNVDTKNADSAYFCKEWKGLYCRYLGLMLSYVDFVLYGFVDYKNKNNKNEIVLM